MANLASVVDACQRTSYVVTGVFNAAFRYVRHVAIGTRNTPLGMNAGFVYFVIGMLCFNDGGAAELMGIVGKPDAVVILFTTFHGQPIVPGENKVFPFGREIILHVALGASQRTHFLLRNLVDVLATVSESFDQSRTADFKVHGFSLVTIGTTDGVYHFLSQRGPRAFVIFGNS
ncbi:hypothetical protein SDC9_112125 [bioreactor metagenome]|uniref:Uncharacterized protein n=1 Tax=bioreactor metagenome TaxID=1076179 RepID=A0A645BID6_9ZZZZ